MKHTLIVSGHTDLPHSVANKTIIETVERLRPEVEVDRLDMLYPDFRIDTAAEQAKLLRADVIVLQFPVFWYSAPSLLERWMEETFAHGFSHGSTGDKLKGKHLILSFTTGAPASMYSKEAGGHPIEDYLVCFESMCRLTQMTYEGYVYTGGVSYGNRTTPELIEAQKAESVKHAERLIAKIEGL